MTFFVAWWPGVVGLQVFMLAQYYDAVYDNYGSAVKGIYVTFIPFWVGLFFQLCYSLLGFAAALGNPNDSERPLLMQKNILSLLATLFLFGAVFITCRRLDFDNVDEEQLPKWRGAGAFFAMALVAYAIWLSEKHEAKCECKKKQREGVVDENKTA